MLSFFVYLECLPRPFTLSLEGLTSLQSVSPVFLPTDRCPPTCPDPVGVTAHYCFKSFTCNTHGSLRKCCKQKTYAQLSPLNATFTKNRGGGDAMVFLVAPPYRYVAPTYLLCFPLLRKLPGVVPKTPILEEGVLPTFKRSTFKLSNDPLVILSSHCSRTPLVPQLATTREFFTIRGNNSALPGV